MNRDKVSLLIVFCLVTFSTGAYAQGILKGRVTFEGTPPPAEAVEVKLDTAVCGTHKEIPKIVLGENKGIANVVVKILGLKGSAPAKGSLDQVHCEFVPHVQALPTGSTLVITSSDSVLHNTHAFYEDKTTAFNIAVPIVGMEVNKKLEKPGILKLRCDAGHTWMGAYILILDEPFAMADANGNFSIENLPPGKYEIEIWQEWLGKTRQTVEIKDGVNEANIILKENK